tara:strand:- start:2412 stop:2954 length:543 start_codon:yes stop_codon:yes gene_type:complete
MFIQTEITPNPNSLKFLTEKKVSNIGPLEIKNKEDSKNELIRNILSINGVKGLFLSENFLSVNKEENKKWEDLKYIIISLINDYYANGNNVVLEKNHNLNEKVNTNEIEKKIIKILETKIRPAVAKDGGDIKFKEFKNGIVKVELQGSCSGCPSSTMTLKQGVENLLRHYIPEVKEVLAL